MTFDVESVRNRFPTLHGQSADGKKPIFLDNPAGTQVPETVMDAVVNYYRHMNANSGGVFATSRRNDAMLREARGAAADFLNAPDADEIVFGPNMTTLNFSLSRALAKTLSSGDEIVLTRMDHDANIAPWLRVAEDLNLTIRWVDIRAEDCTLDMDSLESALSERAKILAVVHASNAVGTINPVRQISDMARAAGAIVVVDAVQSAPHISIDVQEIGCDFLLCSAYKFYGPHVGILWGKRRWLESLPVYKVRPAKDAIPWRWETGTLNFETIHGVTAAINYLASIESGSGEGSSEDHHRRSKLRRSMESIRIYEKDLAARLIGGLREMSGITIAGIIDATRYDERVPTVAFVADGYTPDEVAAYLAGLDIYVWSGDYYAMEMMKALGREDGMVRVGLAHYNTLEEVERLLDALEKL